MPEAAMPIVKDHGLKAEEHLEKALDSDEPWIHVASAGIHAILHVSDSIRHGLRDIVYELRD